MEHERKQLTMNPTSPYLIFTVNIGPPPYSAVTIPRIRHYAHRCGADFLELNEQLSYPLPKLARLEGLKKNYSRFLYLDADVYINPSAPNIFNLRPQNHICARLDPGLDHPANRQVWNEWAKEHNVTTFPPDYINLGVVLLDSIGAEHILKLFVPPYRVDLNEPVTEQHDFNDRLAHCPISPLPTNWNHYHGSVPWDDHHCPNNPPYFTHYFCHSGKHELHLRLLPPFHHPDIIRHYCTGPNTTWLDFAPTFSQLDNLFTSNNILAGSHFSPSIPQFASTFHCQYQRITHDDTTAWIIR